MKGKERIMLIILLAIFLVSLVKLFALRFEWGDVYPQYSSLRADPLGTKILYESLENLEGVSVSRNYRSFSKMSEAPGAFFFIGMKMWDLNSMGKDEIDRLESVAEGGGRLLFLFYPEKGCRCDSDEEEEAAAKDESVEGGGDEVKVDPAGAGPEEASAGDGAGDVAVERKEAMPEEGPDGEDDEEEYIPSIKERWHFGTSLSPLDDNNSHRAHSARSVLHNEALPESIEIHSDIYFEKGPEAGFEAGSGMESGTGPGKEPGKEIGTADEKGAGNWKTIYERDGLPVVMEREFGKGSVVLVADSYFASNESLTGKKESALLAWLVGGKSRIVIDETHLGVSDHPGVAYLARKYDMEALIAAFLLTAVLFIWRNASSFIPPCREEYAWRGEKEGDAGRDHLAGFSGLLKRTIPAESLLPACLREWEKSLEKGVVSSGRLSEVKALIEGSVNSGQGKKDPVALYRRISKLLSERKYKA